MYPTSSMITTVDRETGYDHTGNIMGALNGINSAGAVFG
jgi:hypothetical protein